MSDIPSTTPTSRFLALIWGPAHELRVTTLARRECTTRWKIFRPKPGYCANQVRATAMEIAASVHRECGSRQLDYHRIKCQAKVYEMTEWQMMDMASSNRIPYFMHIVHLSLRTLRDACCSRLKAKGVKGRLLAVGSSASTLNVTFGIEYSWRARATTLVHGVQDTLKLTLFIASYKGKSMYRWHLNNSDSQTAYSLSTKELIPTKPLVM